MTDFLTAEQRQLIDALKAVDKLAAKQMETRFLMDAAGAMMTKPPRVTVGMLSETLTGAAAVTGPLAGDPAPTDPDRAALDRQAQFAKDAEAAGAEAMAEREAQQEEIGELAERLLSLALQPRHREAFDFAVATSGTTPGLFLMQTLRTAAAGWRQDMLEARGQGGATTRKKPPTE